MIKVPKYKEDADEETKRLWEEGCAPKPIELPDMGSYLIISDERSLFVMLY